MSNSIALITKPLADLWNSYLKDPHLQELERFKGTTAGSEWHSKFLRAERDHINKEYNDIYSKCNHPVNLIDILCDNKYRLTILAGLERLFTVRQAQQFLKIRQFMPNSNSFALQNVYQNGYFKGYGAYLLQFFFVGYQSFLWSYGGQFWTKVLYYQMLEAFSYPLDTLRTILQADLTGNYKGYIDCLGKVVESSGYSHLYRGLGLKLTYNVFFLINLKETYENSSKMYITLPLWLASYPLLTFKTRIQVSDTQISFQKLNDSEISQKYFEQRNLKNIYAGFIPFAVTNLLFGYTFYHLYSKKAQDKLLDEVKNKAKHLESPAKENYWS